jgi:hypothetical protein
MILKEDLEVYGIDSEIRILKDDGISSSFRIGAKRPLYTKEIERCLGPLVLAQEGDMV